MKRLTHFMLLLLPLLLLAFLMTGVVVSCSQYNSDSVGYTFLPVNSQVRAYTHLVYVEYSPTGARVWGPCTDEVESSIEGLHVKLHGLADSLVVVAYGYAANHKPIPSGSLTIDQERPYALYLSGLSLSCEDGPVIHCQGKGACYMVVTEKSKNSLTSLHMTNAQQGEACITVDGTLVLGGTGELSIRNAAPASETSTNTHAIAATDVFCQYGVKIDLQSASGDGIHVSNVIRCSQGTWDIAAQRHGIYAGDSLVLHAGTFTGSALDGAFLYNDLGAVLRMPKLTASSGWASSILDSLTTTELFDSVQSVWQESFSDLTIQADTLYQLVDTTGRTRASIKSHHTIQDPFILLSDGQILSDTELSIH